jgi:hypothetical protein
MNAAYTGRETVMGSAVGAACDPNNVDLQAGTTYCGSGPAAPDKPCCTAKHALSHFADQA